MSEFLLVFRRDYSTPEIQPTQEHMREHVKHWADWFRSLAAQDKLAYPVRSYESSGKIVKHQEVASGPYTAEMNSIGA
ncbi:hypothetical protein [Hymenobacter volaticus]|uniref:YCII-related domain-containing protein n=1 Tax=Hymenobacter volaticus TaxID=2932254 RepID=A0ABY4GEU0_9BACT|nr:hypothetical protein [Hymenobacter volaticus]UOQ69435.1 hypothetical protein MUN86_28535 [Hymenobacter volaticus]